MDVRETVIILDFWYDIYNIRQNIFYLILFFFLLLKKNIPQNCYLRSYQKRFWMQIIRILLFLFRITSCT